MLKRFFAAVMCAIVFVSTTIMITSMTAFSAEDSATVEKELSSISTETTVASSETDEESTTTTAETTSIEDVGAAIRESLDVKVMDAVCFDSGTNLYDYDGTPLWSKPGWILWIIGCDDANQRFRVWAPKVKGTTTESRVMYLKYEDATKGYALEEQERLVVGDINKDGRINAIDLTILKRALIYGWNSNDTLTYALADINADGEVKINDAIFQLRWLLGDNNTKEVENNND